MTILIIAVGLIFDRMTKVWAVGTLSKTSEIPVIKNLFSLLYAENNGAAFSIFQGKTMLITIATVIIMFFIILYFIKYKPKGRLMRISLALIISGALGNLIDRIKYKYVVDFISIHYKNIYYFPIFNLADVMVVTGTFILIFCLLRDEKYEN
ncbi:signal peptidase II [Clostridium sp. cel8]|jgi:signal peptidase II|uniref:signal peptidase II n=1 Tax=unclassified Clostridium TaxID=2614128 RepID=UPI0015F4B7F0|nr:signal peptidase II [Clostridium sp. cel8]MBA5850643.1 signal peptidase II [Clostridium sp. cel8]